MANVITCIRIICSILMLFFPTFSLYFYVLYCLSGISDMLDGFIARKTNTASEFGAKLDSLADLVFVAVCLLKFLPAIDIPVWLWIWIATIALTKIINIVSGFICQKKLVMPHTIANKVTGMMLFILPLVIMRLPISCVAIPVCTMATFAAVQEGHFIKTGKIKT